MKSQAFESPAVRLVLLLSITTLLAAFGLSVASLAVPQWMSYSVNGSAAGRTGSSGHVYYSRGRGLFYTCVTDSAVNQLLTLANYSSQARFNVCFDLDLGQLSASSVDFVGFSGAGTEILLLRRWHIGLHAAAVLLLIIGGLLLAYFLIQQRPIGSLFASASCTVAAASAAASLVMFVYTQLLETRPAAAALPSLHAAWPLALQRASDVTLGLSFYLACASAGASLLASVLFMMLGAMLIAEDSGNSAGAKSAYNGGTVDYNNGYQPSGAPSYISAAASHSSAGRLPRTPVAYPNMY